MEDRRATDGTNAPRVKWNWLRIWLYFVISISASTIAAQSTGPLVLARLSEAANRGEMHPDIQANMREFLDRAGTQFKLTTTVASNVCIFALLVTGFLIPRICGPLRNKVPPTS